jgi:hypothetical protein
MATLLDNINENFLEDVVDEANEKNFSNIVLDFSIPLNIRMEAFDIFYNKKGEEDTSELLKRLINIFTMSSSKLIHEYITEIITKSTISTVIRLELAKDLAFCKDADDCFMPLATMCGIMNESDITTIKKIEAVCVLMRCPTYRDLSLLYFLAIISSYNIACEYRYKTILSLKTKYDMRKVWVEKQEKDRLDEDLQFFESESLKYFLNDDKNIPTMRILAAQALLVKYNFTKGVFNIMFSIANNESVEYNTRADATDVVLRYGDEDSKAVAKHIIMKLGQVGNRGEVKTIYENAQNAHSENIEQSAISTFESIVKYKLIKKEGTDQEIDFEYVVDKLGELDDDMHIALNRITMDHALYTKFACSLKTALVVMYSFIVSHEYSELLLDRLKEELKSSAGICSSGIFERIMNTPSGIIDELSITISFEDQITANLTGRLNAKIRGIVAKPCLHMSNTLFCDCKSRICVAGREKLSGAHARRQKGVDYTACNKCITCRDVKCAHECMENCNETICDSILEEMSLPTNQYSRRQTFLKFFRTTISSIMEELREEFLEYMDEATFELYMKRAIMNYEGEY